MCVCVGTQHNAVAAWGSSGKAMSCLGKNKAMGFSMVQARYNNNNNGGAWGVGKIVTFPKAHKVVNTGTAGSRQLPQMLHNCHTRCGILKNGMKQAWSTVA